MGKDTDIVRLGKLKSYCWHNSGDSVLSKPWVILREKSVMIPIKLPLFFFSNLRIYCSEPVKLLVFIKQQFFCFRKHLYRRNCHNDRNCLGPYEYIHVLDKNSNVTRLEQGPQVFVRKDHELVTNDKQKFLIIPPRHYVVIENPVERNEVSF